jgi:hypothetical protein
LNSSAFDPWTTTANFPILFALFKARATTNCRLQF